MAFTAEEKEAAKYWASYPDWQALASSIILGFPSGNQTLYLIEQALEPNRLTPQAQNRLRKIICRCEAIEEQMFESTKRMKASKIGDVTLNPREQAMLNDQLMYWITRLVDVLGCYPNPYSQMVYTHLRLGGGINAKVNS